MQGISNYLLINILSPLQGGGWEETGGSGNTASFKEPPAKL